MPLQAKFVALALLREKPMTGYEIKKQFEGVIAFFYDGSYGSVYPTLKNLEEQGCIEKRTIVQADRPNKHEFSITEDGRRMLEQFFAQPLEEDDVRSEICMRLYFGSDSSRDDMRGWIETSIAQHNATLKQLQDLHERHGRHMPLHQLLSLTVGIGYHQGKISALLECVKLLDDSEGD